MFRGGFKLSIIYKCRHCGHLIGELEQGIVSSSALGLDMLNESEKQNIVAFQQNGDIHLKVICESCEDTLTQHPNYYELEYFIQ